MRAAYDRCGTKPESRKRRQIERFEDWTVSDDDLFASSERFEIFFGRLEHLKRSNISTYNVNMDYVLMPLVLIRLSSVFLILLAQIIWYY